MSCYEIACSLSDAALCARARALQAAVSLHRGDLRGALDLAVDAERYAERCDDLAARVATPVTLAVIDLDHFRSIQ